MTQSMTTGKPSRRALPIVPAIPRKLERKAQQDASHTAIPKSEVGKAEQPGKGTHSHDTGVTGAPNPGFTNLDRAMDSVSEQQEGSRTTTQELVDDPNAEPAATTEDFGIEKHRFRLPPPFYPSHPPPVFSPTESPELAGRSDSHLPLPNTILGNEGDVAAEYARSDLSNPSHPQVSSSTLHSHLISPDDVAPSPTQSSYQGYGHVQYVPFYPQPTPPTEPSISPTRSAYRGVGHSHSISFCPPPSSLFDNISSPTQSLYQGYSYGHTYPESQVFPQSYNHTQPFTNTSIPFSHEYGPGMQYHSQAPAFPSLGSHPPLTPSATPLNSAINDGPNNFLPYQNLMQDSASSTSTIPNDSEPPHRTTSESTLGLDDALSLSPSSKHDSPTVTLTRDPAFEIWRTAMLEILQHTPLDAFFDQPSLSSYLLQRFNTDDAYADCYLQLVHRSHRFEAMKFRVHSLLITQSPKLQFLLGTSGVEGDGKRLIYLDVQDRYSTPAAIKRALRVCYGESPYLFTGSAAFIESSKSIAEVSISWMDEALAFAAAGQVLQLKSVLARGMQISSAILNWDNLEGGLSFALERRLDRTREFIPHLQPRVNHSTEVPLSSSEGTTTSSNNNSPVEPAPLSTISDLQPNIRGQDATTDALNDFLYKCLHFILLNCPDSWYLDVSARPLANNDRLPAIAESRSPMSKSRLSRIQFGDHPSENSAKSSDPSTILSSILLSIPFGPLKYVLDHFEESITRRNSRTIVAERERRRQRVLKSDNLSALQKQAAADVWAEAGWEEFIAEEEISRLVVARKWTGF